MRSDTTRYFQVMHDFDFSCTQRSYFRALKSLREGLRLTPAALEAMHEQLGGQPSVPFFESKGGAIAALFNDTESFELMDVVMKMSIVTRKVDVGRYRRDAIVMDEVRILVANEPGIEIDTLKKAFEKDDAGRLTRLLGWMAKHGELTLDKDGKSRYVTLGRPAREEEPVLPTFRSGLNAQETPLLRLNRRVLGTDTLGNLTAPKEDIYSEYNRREPDTIVDEQSLPAALRQPGIMKTRTTSEGTWLIASSKELPNGTFSTLVNRYLLDGTRTDPLSLPHRIYSVYSEPKRPGIVTIDQALNVRAYSFSGEILVSISLWDNPEIRHVFSDAPVDMKETALARGLDISVERSEIAFSIADRFWLFNLDGTPILSFRLPAVPSDTLNLNQGAASVALQTALVAHGLAADSTHREIAEWLDGEDIMPKTLLPSHILSISMKIDLDEDDEDEFIPDLGSIVELDVIVREIKALKRDWIYFLRLSNDGESMWLSSYSGLVVRLARTGEVVGAWTLPTSVGDIIELDGRHFASQQTWFTELSPLDPPSPICRGFGLDSAIGGRHIAKRYERDLVVGDLLTGSTKSILLKRDFRAVYPTVTGMRVETTTTFADIAL